MRTLIIGYGEVGKALDAVLDEVYEVLALDRTDEDYTHFEPEILHITFPYSDKFVDYVKEYQEKFKPKYTVIHSTTPVGISRKCGAIHSPIRGKHPFLAEGIKTFVKYFGGDQVSEVADYFRLAGIRVCLYDKSETTEAMKLFDTEYYKVCIEFCQRVKRYCDEHNLNFHEIYTLPNESYNSGYTALGNPEFVRPILQPIMKEIGGHCVLENSKLIDG